MSHMLIANRGRHGFAPPARFDAAVGCPTHPSRRALTAVFLIDNTVHIFRLHRLRRAISLTIHPGYQSVDDK